MVTRGLSIGFFGLFGRSSELGEFDAALRSVDLHPRLVPEAVKLAAVKLLQERVKDRAPEPRSYREAAEIIAYCMTGGQALSLSSTCPSRRGLPSL